MVSMAIRYATPRSFLIYDANAIAPALADAKVAVLALKSMPTEITETKFYEWVKALPKAKQRSLPL
jgi:hypothetical protein